MNKLSPERRASVVRALVEGNSIRATVRMTGVAKNTISKLLLELGDACLEYQDVTLRHLPCKNIQCDEIWAFCGMKERNVPTEEKGELGKGDVWTWTALDADTKLICCFHVGKRTAADAHLFIQDLASRLAHRVQLTTDGWKMYLNAVMEAFDFMIDYAMLTKLYGDTQEAPGRYSPACCTGTESKVISGHPDPKKISTSHVERQNLTMRMCMRRFTRLTNAFSKKLENMQAAIALHFMWYNFGRTHATLTKDANGYPTTPAMKAGLSDHPWTVEEIIGLLDSAKPDSLNN